jgi:hypothetical protein
MSNISIAVKGNSLECVATGRVRSGVRAIVDAHMHPEKAGAFRDIGKYASYDILRDGTVVTEYPAKVAFFKFTMHVNKKLSRNGDSTIVDFYTPKGLAAFRGKWTLTPETHGAPETHGTRVSLVQTMQVPGWALRVLPVASAFRSRIVRAFEDMDALE